MIWAMFAGGLIVGTVAGWMLCALCTVGYDYEQRILIARLKSLLCGFLMATEQYHDDAALANVCKFARQLLEEKG